MIFPFLLTGKYIEAQNNHARSWIYHAGTQYGYIAYQNAPTPINNLFLKF